jgi:hypothetical protein
MPSRDVAAAIIAVVLRYLQCLAERHLCGAAPGFGHHQRVLEDYVIEAGALHCLREFDKEFAVPGRAAMGKGFAPISCGKIGKPSEMKPLRQSDLLLVNNGLGALGS